MSLTLIDTSVWIGHFRDPEPGIVALLAERNLRIHPYVVGELALGSIPDRARLLAFLTTLPAVVPAANARLVSFIEANVLSDSGIGFVDAHLLKACADNAARLWTHDKRLAAEAERLGLLHAA